MSTPTETLRGIHGALRIARAASAAAGTHSNDRLAAADRELAACRQLLADARMPNAAVIHDPTTGAPLRAEVPYDEWHAFRAAWRAAGGSP